MNIIPKISITGTKGKTTTAYCVSEALQQLGRHTLRVDTTGHYIDGRQSSTLEDSKEIWGLVPTVCPGRYLWEFQHNKDLATNGIAVLETALGSSRLPGLGYREHLVGVFLNVFEDHLGSTERLKTKEDIALAKDFIYRCIERDGWAVFNADDPLVVERLKVVPKDIGIKLLPCGLTFEHFDVQKHLDNGGFALTVEGSTVLLRMASGTKTLLDLAAIPWTFNGKYMPSVWNVLMSAGALFAYLQGDWTDESRAAMEAVRLDPHGGRMTLLKSSNGATVIADYAHEKVSLSEVGKLARSLVKDGGRVIGIVRLAHDRTDDLIEETGAIIGQSFDECIIYEKIDGYWRQPKNVRSKRFPQVIGRTSEILAKGARSTNDRVTRILREDEAVQHAAKIARSEDVVVMIVNDDIRRSLEFVQRSFDAKFL